MSPLQSIEVPRVCNVELPLTYHMFEFLEPESPWWIVAYTELIVKTAEFVLFDVNESCTLWALRHEMIQVI